MLEEGDDICLEGGGIRLWDGGDWVRANGGDSMRYCRDIDGLGLIVLRGTGLRNIGCRNGWNMGHRGSHLGKAEEGGQISAQTI